MPARAVLLRRALWLAWLTVAWNVAEGAVAVLAGTAAGSQALLGFGADSAVESLSGAVLAWRLRAELAGRDGERVERRARRAIGATLLLLAVWVGGEATRSLAARAEPQASPAGIALTALSLVVMPALASRKRALARALGSRAGEADSVQTLACALLSAVVLGGLALNAALGWWWADPLAALGVAVYLVREGREALDDLR